MSDYITAIIGTLSTIVSAYVSHIVTKRKYNAEVDNSQIHNMSEALTFYKDLCDDNRERLNVLSLTIKDQESEIRQIKLAQQAEIKQIKLDMLNLQKQICSTPNCKLRTI